jgi:hypothetical protein
MDKSPGTKLSRTPGGGIPPAKSSAELFGWRTDVDIIRFLGTVWHRKVPGSFAGRYNISRQFRHRAML